MQKSVSNILFWLSIAAVVLLRLMGIEPSFDVPPVHAIGLLGAVGVGAGINIVANAVGNIIGNRQKKRAQRQYMKELEASNMKYNTDLQAEIGANYLDRADSRAAVKRVMDYNTEQAKRYDTNGIRRGVSDEAKVAMAGEQSKALGDVVSQISAQGAQYKTQLREQLRNAQHAQEKEKAGIRYGLGSDTSYLTNMMGAIGQSAGQIVSAYALSHPGGGATGNIPGADTPINTGPITDQELNGYSSYA
jgi:hypothetical protein